MSRIRAAAQAAFLRVPMTTFWFLFFVLAVLFVYVLALIALDIETLLNFDPGGGGGQWPPIGPWNTGGGGGGGGGGSW